MGNGVCFLKIEEECLDEADWGFDDPVVDVDVESQLHWGGREGEARDGHGLLERDGLAAVGGQEPSAGNGKKWLLGSEEKVYGGRLEEPIGRHISWSRRGCSQWRRDLRVDCREEDGTAGKEEATREALGQVDASDQVSSVSATDMIEEIETQGEEVLSMEMGQSSLHEVDDTLVPVENGLQIVPWEIMDEVIAASEMEDEQNIFMHRGGLCKRRLYARERSIHCLFGNMQIEESFVNDEIKATRDTLWNEINEEFEADLQRLNFMNTHALVVTHLHDEIVNTTHICTADHEMYLEGLLDRDQKLIAAVRKKNAKGTEPWYPLTRRYLGRLIYDIQMTKEKEKRVALIKQSLSAEEHQKEEERICEEITHKYQDRIGKLLNIVDPNLGTDWLARVLSLKWEADKITRSVYGLKKGDHVFRIEGFLARVFQRAFQIVSDLLDVPAVVPLQHDCTLAFYFEEIKFEARPYLFPIEVSLGVKTKDIDKQALKNVDTLRMAAQRLAFRFFMFLVAKSVLPAMPFLARQWTQLAIQDTSMYPSTMHTLTPWEIDNCPWWIDMEKGHLLGRERELQEMISKDAAMKVPPVDIVEESRVAMCNSQKEKERVVDQIIDEEVEPPPVAPGTIVARRSISFVYIMESPSHCLSSSMDTRCMAIDGDYIAIAADYRAGIRNLAWVPVHKHLVRARSDSILYTRGTKSISWAADLIFLDLPFGGSLLGSSTSPCWDICIEDHVRAGVHLAFSTLADIGWLLIMVSLAGGEIFSCFGDGGSSSHCSAPSWSIWFCGEFRWSCG
ncbi:hypothetical protein GOP47_0008369, partial [Adiantum capillus-veneris]